jgi:hypothetical protein
MDEDEDDEDEDDELALVIDESQSKPFRPRENVCSVCRRAFSSPLELGRHFRGHGMAFLKTAKHTPTPPPPFGKGGGGGGRYRLT